MVRIWDVETGDELLTLKGHRVTVRSVAWSTYGRWIASGGGESRRRSDEDAVRPGEWRLWNAATGAERLAVFHDQGLKVAWAEGPWGGGNQLYL